MPSATCNGAGSSRWVGETGFAAAQPVLGLLLGFTALGIRWAEGIWAAGRVAAGSLWVGRQLGDAAGAATLRSGRLVRDGWPGSSSAAAPATARPAVPEERPRRAPQARASAGDAGPRRVEDAPAAAAAELPAPAPAAAACHGAADRRAARPPPDQAQAGPPPEPDAELPETDFELPRPRPAGAVKPMNFPGQSPQALTETSRQLETVLDDFGVRGEIIDAKTGPVVTLYELEPAPGTRAARVISLADDIARSLCALSVRVAVVPGRNVIGIELPNERRATVYLRELLEAAPYTSSGARLPLALGKDIPARRSSPTSPACRIC